MWRQFGRGASRLRGATAPARPCRTWGKSLYDGPMASQRPLAARHGLNFLMSDIQRPTEHLKRDVSGQGRALFATLVHLWPYIWPADRRDLKNRVIFATALIFAAKFATIAVPFTFKWATDALAGHGTAPIAPDNWLAWALASPILMTLAYGGTRILMGVLTQWRDGIFAKVAM